MRTDEQGLSKVPEGTTMSHPGHMGWGAKWGVLMGGEAEPITLWGAYFVEADVRSA